MLPEPMLLEPVPVPADVPGPAAPPVLLLLPAL
jgi:hypothetical protein